MLVNESKYKWKPWTQPVFTADDTWGQLTASSIHNVSGVSYAAFLALDGNPDTQWEGSEGVLVATFQWQFPEPLRIYRIELVNKASGGTMVTKNVTAYADAEKTVEVVSGTFALSGRSTLQLEPASPVATDCLVLALSGESKYVGLSEITLIAEEGIQKIDLTSLYNTADGMTMLRDTLNDDGTDTLTGLGGFFFNNLEAKNLYVSGNHWIGFGTASEQLQILRRDGICDHLYRSEGTIGAAIPYVKLRWEGYTVYNARADANRLIFELFLLGNNDMILNLIQTPTGTSYLGTSALICNGQTMALTLANGDGAGKRVSFYHRDAKGMDWVIDYAEYTESDSYTSRFLIRNGTTYYRVDTIKDQDLNDVQVLTQVDIQNLTAAMFLKFGFIDPPPGTLLIPLSAPEIIFWTANPFKISKPRAVLKAYPHPQTISVTVDMSSASIQSLRLISAEYTGHIGVRYSVDNGTSYCAEMTLAAFLHTDVAQLWASLPANRVLLLDFILYEDAQLTRFKFTYNN